MEKRQVLMQIIYLVPNEIKVNGRFRKELGLLEDLKKSIMEVGLLEPVGVTKDKVLVFGERRLRAWEQVNQGQPIPCVVVDGDLYKFKLAELDENVKRKGVDWQDEVLAIEEIKQTYEKLYGWKEHGGDRKSDDFKKSTLSGGIDSQTKLAEQMNCSQQKLSQDLQLAQAIKTQPKIKKMKSKRKALQKLRQIQAMEQTSSKSVPVTFEYEPEVSNLWIFDKCDNRFGVRDYPGRMAGQIVVNLLHFYTNPDDCVVDPFVGSGTTLDVCKAMNRKCKAYDLRPVLPEILENDTSKGIPIVDETTDFVLLDPPYANMKKGEYTDNPNDLSNMNLDDYYRVMAFVIAEAWRILRDEGKMALIASSMRRDGKFTDIGFHLYKLAEGVGFKPIERIIVPYGGHEASFNGAWIQQARETKFMLRKYRDLVVFQK
jgi:hypothetical protein